MSHLPTNSPLIDALRQDVRVWQSMGHPALLQAFVLKHGTHFTGCKRPKGVRLGRIKQCFGNAANRTLFKDDGGDYYEGYAIWRKMPVLPILHAWNVIDGRVIDVTLRKADEYEYLGVHFPTRTLRTEIVKRGVYGLLDTGRGINVPLIKQIDAPLVRDLLDPQALALRREAFHQRVAERQSGSVS